VPGGDAPGMTTSDVLVLCYHAVSADWRGEYAVTPQQLTRQVELLLARGYHPARFCEAVTAPPAARTVSVTFDDALRSVAREALPVLSGLDVPATVFACSDWVQRAEPMRIGYEQGVAGTDERELVSMSWEELALLRDAGWEIGSHTRTHPHLTALDDATLAEELAGSRTELSARLGVRCRSLAYPYGEVDERVTAATRAAGYDAACTATAGTEAPSPLLWPRVAVRRRDAATRFRFKTAYSARRLRGSSSAWRLLAPVYRVAGGGHRGGS
jgi:peptidoglycan/xylan/chitin deacetylase (PgdA/CDA1 family)